MLWSTSLKVKYYISIVSQMHVFFLQENGKRKEKKRKTEPQSDNS